MGQANRYYSSNACTEPIAAQPTGPGEYAGIGRTISLVQDETPQSMPPLEDLTSDETPDSVPEFWSYSSQKSPEGKDIIVHYCKSLKNTEKVAKYFAEDEVLGFDMEWKAQVSASDSLQNNVSLIQLANKSRIALFQVAMFKPAKGVKDLVAPTLKKILESPDITKVGVSIKADCTRLRKFLKIDARAIFELSHLHKLVKHCHSNPRLINKRLVSLNDQVEEHFGLPLVKEESVRCSDWTVALNYPQVQCESAHAHRLGVICLLNIDTPFPDAATDPYACICLFDTLNAKRQSLDPMPPLPAHAELDLPIRVVEGSAENVDSDDVQLVDQKADTPAEEDTKHVNLEA
ncbi:3'-5' exonuclease [Aspergillus affinis]|uniref:3'-5' exonuclease n=1 Tax=Aspergillus affinis TaxID=1070780 RepID=UPI0022FE6B41|nr:ribonuclease H-like protein [Aspergillus affinis]KAI9042266.1 ribonuclease H-like protein [Aspergillus affinis]